MPEELKLNDVAVDNEPQSTEKMERPDWEYALLFGISIVVTVGLTRVIVESIGLVIPRVSVWTFFGSLAVLILADWLIFQKLLGWHTDKYIPKEVANWVMVYFMTLLWGGPSP